MFPHCTFHCSAQPHIRFFPRVPNFSILSLLLPNVHAKNLGNTLGISLSFTSLPTLSLSPSFVSSVIEPKLGSARPLVVKPIYWCWVVVKESAASIVRRCTGYLGQLALKKSELLYGFRQSIFKDKVSEGSPRACDQLVHNSPIGWWWGNRAVTQGLTVSILRCQ